MGGAGAPTFSTWWCLHPRETRSPPTIEEITMMLENGTAAIYAGGGAIGGAVARAFADAGARVSLAGRSRAGSRR
jgi:sugar/nucleoside kinase (ribokinase family)